MLISRKKIRRVIDYIDFLYENAMDNIEDVDTRIYAIEEKAEVCKIVGGLDGLLYGVSLSDKRLREFQKRLAELESEVNNETK